MKVVAPSDRGHIPISFNIEENCRSDPLLYLSLQLRPKKFMGAMTLSITTFRIITLSIMTISIMTISIMAFIIMTLSIMTQ
jgi:hypothetical protein